MTRARDLANLIVHEHEAGLTYVKTTGTASAGQTTVTGLTYTAGLVDIYLNGIKLIVGTDVTATNGTSITLAAGAAAENNYQNLGPVRVAKHYTNHTKENNNLFKLNMTFTHYKSQIEWLAETLNDNINIGLRMMRQEITKDISRMLI